MKHKIYHIRINFGEGSELELGVKVEKERCKICKIRLFLVDDEYQIVFRFIGYILKIDVT